MHTLKSPGSENDTPGVGIQYLLSEYGHADSGQAVNWKAYKNDDTPLKPAKVFQIWKAG
jgi:hypothetical protein